MKHHIRWILAAALAVCAGAASAEKGRVGECRDCGTVRAVDVMNKSGEASGKGAVLGAVVGGVVGHQFGSGRGNDAATVGGAVAGGVVGHQAEKKANAGSYYRITIDMDRGSTREVNVADAAGLHSGDRVRVVGKNLERVD
jgi:outer membrane lipoprotein SlyB